MTTSLQMDVQRAADLLRTTSDVTLLAHIRPDADALGSAFALGNALVGLGADVRVSCAWPPSLPESFRSLDSADLFVRPDKLPHGESVLVVLDAASVTRLGGLGDRVARQRAAGGPVLVIDHHVSNTRFGTMHVIDETAEATVVLVCKVLDELGARLDEPIARCLYAGLATDTGGFRRATAETHRFAARLLESGVEPARLLREISDTRPFAWIPMLSEVLAGVTFDADAVGRRGLVYGVVSRSVAARVRHEDVEGVIDVLSGTREAEVAIVLKEDASGSQGNRWTISLRSARDVDVSSVARVFGGGGHLRAAGCTIEGTVDEVINSLREELDMLQEP